MGRVSNFFKTRYGNLKGYVKKGLGATYLHDTGRLALQSGAGLLQQQKKTVQTENFEEATKRLKISEADLKEREKTFTLQIIMYGCSALLALGYAIYLGMTKQQFISIMITVLISLILMIYAFRSHFWLFQVKQRKLGCTIKEWLNSSVKELN